MATINGTTGNDILVGTADPDLLDALAGDDFLIGGAGADTLAGGPGSDIALFNIATDGADSIDLGTGADSVLVAAAAAGEVRVTFTSAEVGNNAVNDGGILTGQDGGLAVRLQAEDGAGALTGPIVRSEDEGIAFLSSTSGLTFDVRDLVSGVQRGNLFEVVVLGTAGADTLAAPRTGLATYTNAGAGNDTVTGSTGNDFLVGGGGLDSLVGAEGNDSLLGGGGNDALDGGAGDDVAIFNVSTDGADSISLGAGSDVVNVAAAAAGQVRLTFTSAEVGNGSGSDAGTTAPQDGGLAVRLQLEDGSDGLTAATTRVDDEGTTFISTTAGLTFDVRDLVSGAARGDLFEIVQLGTSAGDDISAVQTARPYYINAGGGNDSVRGGNANDFLVGGGGNDLVVGNRGQDTILAGGGADTIFTVDSDVNIFAAAAAPERDSVDAGDGDDTVTAGRLDQLTGGLGSDSLFLNFGFNGPSAALAVTLALDAAGAGTASDGTAIAGFEFLALNLTEAADSASTGNVRVNLSGEGGNDTLTAGSADDVVSGGNGDDVLSAGDGANTLSGGAGNDTITAGSGTDSIDLDVTQDGADSVNLGAGQDTVRFGGPAAQVRVTFTSAEVGNGAALDAGTMLNQDGGLAVRLQAEDTTGALVGPVSRYDDEGITFVQGTQGTTFDVRDLVAGTQRGNLFEAVVLGTSGGDALTFSPPFRSASPTYYNAGGGDDTVTAGSGADFLVGGGGSDLLTGDAGNDSFIGGAGDDRLVGGTGNDSLDGGLGADTIVFAESFGSVRYARTGTGTQFTGTDGQDNAANYEQLVFDDSTIVLNTSFFGTTDTGASSVGGQLITLYDGLLQRAPDRAGLEFFAEGLESGASLSSIAQAFLSSGEYTARNGDVTLETNEGFVAEMYQVALGRAPDSGAQFFIDGLNGGASRADVAAAIATSGENAGSLQGQLNAGVFVPNADASAAARLFLGLLDRAPDGGGLTTFTQAIEGGLSVRDAAQGILDSAEYGARFGALDDQAYVNALYDNALGRSADAGSSFWTGALASGASRADVAVGITQGSEAQGYLAVPLEQGWISI